MKIVFVVIAVLAMLFFLGCTQTNTQANNNPVSSDGGTTAGTVTPTDSNNPLAGLTHNVRIANMNFYPADITINVGDTVAWRNEDSLSHTVTSDIPGSFGSGTLGLGIIYEHKFTSPGTFGYHCSFHPNMTGRVIVK